MMTTSKENQKVWLNGEVVRMADARIGVEDRGFQFADGVYEVIRLYGGRPFTLGLHLERLGRSAAGIAMEVPISLDALRKEIERFLTVENPGDGIIYVQLTRGLAARNHLFPKGAKATLLFYTRYMEAAPLPGQGGGVKLKTVEDDRWKRCWVKSIALLANVLAKNVAADAGADEALFVDGGVVNECSASNFFIVKNGRVITHPVGAKVLGGITRDVLLDCAKRIGVEVEERGIALDEVWGADEAFITSTTREISWVSQIDDRALWRRCGEVSLRLHEAIHERTKDEG